ncbi:ABC transporter substrate-binding protein [Deinococcus metallilatus]|uniref:Iron complex transport system substrate-binding protein n=1 Tax=Deinococcus metallilatus TaxID=1211322 RepID=A0ABR6MRJ0_9DEIO|nr:ABC transporter substrate-binding protein [Deinococcus metallilatus]MBB5294558.1 iron complex transport system substrate-binding protein [Deinococcus metallilatus]GMA15771.1 ABC transporter substrate-binding protein [Deinococcus metallilatus]
MHKLLTLTTLTLTAGAAGATTYPLTLTDDLGRQVTLRSEPKRIVSVLPSDTETLCALGVCDQLVGVDEFSDFPAQVTRLPKVGGLYNPNVEAMVALRPDLVIVSKYGKLAGPLTQAGIPVLAVNPETYDDVFSKTLLLGKVVNREAQAKTLVLNMKRDIARVEILTKNAVRKPTTYFEIDPTPYSIGPNSFMGVLLTKAGARNIIPASLGDFPKVDPEFVVKANPELMLGLDLGTARSRPGWNSIQAVKTGRVLPIPKDLNTILGRPGPRLPQALRGLARLIHPELFR